MPRFFVSPESFCDKTVTVTGTDAFHIARSLRMAVGDAVTACDGEGFEYECVLRKIRDDACECEIKEKRLGLGEPPVDITLYMGYPKGDKLELVVQKAVELGVKKVVPFISSRCVKRPDRDKSDKLATRLSRIAEEAAKQCGRARLAEICAPVSFADMLTEAKLANIPLFCYENENTTSLKKVLFENAGAKTISLVIGCEGGFSEAERAAAEDAGLISVGLGKRILRCETAPLYALSAISFALEL